MLWARAQQARLKGAKDRIRRTFTGSLAHSRPAAINNIENKQFFALAGKSNVQPARTPCARRVLHMCMRETASHSVQNSPSPKPSDADPQHQRLGQPRCEGGRHLLPQHHQTCGAERGSTLRQQSLRPGGSNSPPLATAKPCSGMQSSGTIQSVCRCQPGWDYSRRA